MIKHIVTIIILLICSTNIYAHGITKIAKSNRSLWVYDINSASSFDFASKMEMLMYVKHLDKVSHYSADEFKTFLNSQDISEESIHIFIAQMKDKIISNYMEADLVDKYDYLPVQKNITWDKLVDLVAFQSSRLPKELRRWYKNADKFYETYVYEQIRLANLFPKITSEILQHNNQEITGYKMIDKSVRLTFDDGPTKQNGNTDKLIKLLDAYHIKGIFFLSGTSLKKRNDVVSLYKNQIIGSHGYRHIPHISKDIWQTSLRYTLLLNKIISSQNKGKCYFRPPYGERSADFSKLILQNKCKVVLWNIDSQDWNKKMTAQNVLDRITTLTLLWRSGIILFHDTNDKSLKILDTYITNMKKAGIEFNSTKS